METDENGILKDVFVFLGMPIYDGMAYASTVARGQSQGARKIRFMPQFEGSSVICHVFNRLWIQALGAYPTEKPFTHFAMLHNDIVPDPWWIDTLWDEMQATGATVVSAVAAIKDAKGVTSTAFGDPADPWDYRRITLTELQKLPKTFTMEEIEASRIWPKHQTEGKQLLVNTGCMLIDLSWPHWLDKEPDGITFTFRFDMDYRIQQWPNGTWNPEFAPEDWRMSRYIQAHGGKVVATRKVGTIHMGMQHFPSTVVWGSATDVEIDAFIAQKAKVLGPQIQLPPLAEVAS